MGEKDNGLGLPQVPVADFNRLARQKLGTEAPTWTDEDKDGNMVPNEIRTQDPKILTRYVEDTFSGAVFTKKFKETYRKIAGLFRQELVKKEISLTWVEDVSIDLDAWLKKNTGASRVENAHYKVGLKYLLKAAHWQNIQYQHQIGYSERLKAENRMTADDRELISRYDHPWCIGNTSPFCVALPSIPLRGSGVYLDDITCEQAKGGLLSLENPFSTVKRDENGFIVPTPYATAFKEEQTQTALNLRLASGEFRKIPRERILAKHLMAVAGALESNRAFPYLEADATWHKQGDSDSIFLIRVGSDEVGADGVGDNCALKARAQFRLGLVNRKTEGLVNKFKPYLQAWEDGVARLVADPSAYETHKVVLKLPRFYDVIQETGDSVDGPNGTSIGQSLPNWCGEDGMLEPCRRRIMIYTNKANLSYSDKIIRRYVLPLFAPTHVEDFAIGDVAIEGIVLHEIGHNFGPQQGMKRPGTENTYDSLMGKWRGVFEEGKAQTLSLYLTGDMLKKTRSDWAAGKITKAELAAAEKRYRQRMMFEMVWAVRMVLRGTRASPAEVKGNSYSKLAAVQIGFLAEVNAITYDEQIKQWRLNFENDAFMKGVERLMEKILKLYAGGDFAKADEFVSRYVFAGGEGFKHLHADRIIEAAGEMPSVTFRYDIQFGREHL